MRIELILRYIGLSLLLEALFMFMSAAVSAYDGYDDAFLPLVYSGFLAGILGAFPRIFVRKNSRLRSNEGYYIVIGSWLICCLFGAMPYLMYSLSPTDAIFESVSGFTTTGASILDDIEALPQGLLFWRMSTAWIGGIGIVALFSMIVPAVGGNSATLAGAEVSDIARSYSPMKQNEFAKMMILTYVILTMVSIVALKLCGLRWFDAVTHAMSACSTCGFSTKNASISAFGSPLVEAVLIIIMLLASVRFVLLSGLLRKGGARRLFESEVTKVFLLMILIGTLLMTAGLQSEGGSLLGNLRVSAFQVASIFTTTGFATADTNTWPIMCKSLLIAGSLVCGCSGSTSGGIKTDRFVIAMKGMVNKMRSLQSPNALFALKVDKSIITEKTAVSVFVFIISYLFITGIGTLLFSGMGLDMKTGWTAAIACMGNVGPGFGEIGSMGNYAGLPLAAKWLSTILMIIGRLEIFPLLFIFVAHKTR